MKILSNGQLFSIMIVSSFFHIMCMQSSFSKNQMLGAIISAVFQLAVVTALIYFKRKNHLDVFFNVKWVNIIYRIVLIAFALAGVYKLYNIMIVMNFPIGVIFGCILMAGVCLYCASLGFRTLARSSVPIFVLIVISLFIMLYGSYDKLDINRFLETKSDVSFADYAIDSFLSSIELILLPALLLITKDSGAKGAYGYIAAKAFTIEAISFLGITLLGSENTSDKYPFFLIGAESQPFSVQRADGIYLILFTLVCGVNIITAESLRRHLRSAI